jgi:beta-mannosidase
MLLGRKNMKKTEETRIINLSGKWLLNYYKVGEGAKSGVYRDDFSCAGWIEAQVPGNVQLDLLHAGRIREPFYGKNAEECKWMEEVEWWYRKEFTFSGEIPTGSIELVFKGLDTFATIWLNGKKIGVSRNMFRPAVFEVKDRIRLRKRNVLVVKIDPPGLKVKHRKVKKELIERLLGREKKLVENYQERFFVRKSQISYGWDMAPRLLTAGIWKDVELYFHSQFSIENVFIKTKIINKKSAELEVDIFIRSFTRKRQSITLKLEVSYKKKLLHKRFQARLEVGETAIKVKMEIENPHLWWPWNVGKPDLYKLDVWATGKDTTGNYSTKFGIREVKLLQEYSERLKKKSFVILINGRRIFAKGANWVPPDAVFGRISWDKNKELLILAKEANINMIRVWGGGIIDERLYEICDKLGIMVWQDFMFACGLYPDYDRGFVKEVKRECAWIVKHLYNHPSIVLWCGGNELEGWTFVNISGNKIFLRYLPGLLEKIDPTRPYRPSSPWGGEKVEDKKGKFCYHSPGMSVTRNCQNLQYIDQGLCFKCPENSTCDLFINSTKEDVHNWSVWWGRKPYRVYAKDRSSFTSEFGQQSFPCTDTLLRFIPPDKLWPLGEYYRYHNADLGPQKIALRPFGKPKNVNEYVKLTQLSQAVAYKYAIEHYRRRKFESGGCLYWKLNDIWPGISCSVIDYYLNPKIAYYYTKKAYANLLVSFKEEGENISVWITSDYFNKIDGELEIRHRDFKGQTLGSSTLDVVCPANMSSKIRDIEINKLRMKRQFAEYLHCRLKVKGKVVSENTYFFVEPKDLQLPLTELDLKWDGIKDGGSETEDKFEIRISTTHYARMVELNISARKAYFSDNYFDILPGEEKKVLIKTDNLSRGETCSLPLTLTVKALNSHKLTLEGGVI